MLQRKLDRKQWSARFGWTELEPSPTEWAPYQGHFWLQRTKTQQCQYLRLESHSTLMAIYNNY